MKITKSELKKLIREEVQSLGVQPASYDELLDGLKAVTQALSDVVGHGGGPYDHLISDLDYAKDLIRRSSK